MYDGEAGARHESSGAAAGGGAPRVVPIDPAWMDRAYDLATLAWVVVFGARFAVQRWLYDSAYAETWLGWVRLAMGVPLALLAAAVTVWAIRRATEAAKAEKAAAEDAAPA